MDETLREKLMKNPRFREMKSGNAYVIVPFHAASVTSEDAAAYEQAAENEQRKRDAQDA